MIDDIAEEPVRSRLLVGIFGLAAAGAGLIAFIGLIFGPVFLASLGSDKIPMAPSTALFFFVYGFAIFLCTYLPMNRGIRCWTPVRHFWGSPSRPSRWFAK